MEDKLFEQKIISWHIFWWFSSKVVQREMPVFGIYVQYYFNVLLNIGKKHQPKHKRKPYICTLSNA